jgi:hypothetical protein
MHISKRRKLTGLFIVIFGYLILVGMTVALFVCMLNIAKPVSIMQLKQSNIKTLETRAK